MHPIKMAEVIEESQKRAKALSHKPIRRVSIPKKDGTLRYLGVPDWIDRIATKAIFRTIFATKRFELQMADSVREVTNTQTRGTHQGNKGSEICN